LMVDLLAEDADLSVLDGDDLILTRTVRLGSSEDRDVQSRGLLGEIRRTIAAASNQLGGRRVEKVVLCGDGAEHAAMKSLVQQELSLAVEMFDPFTELPLGPELQDRHPTGAGRFAPLLGLLVDEATGTPHAVDFLHPRKKREKADSRRRYVMIGATLAACLLAALFLVWGQLGAMDDDIEALRSRSAGMKRELAEADKWVKDAASIQLFLDHRLNWLDEMEWLSVNLPPAADVIVDKTAFTVEPPNGAELSVEGFTRERTGYEDVDSQLRKDGRTVKSEMKAPDPKRERYQFGFKERVLVPAAAQAAPPAKAPAADAAAGRPGSKTTGARTGGKGTTSS